MAEGGGDASAAASEMKLEFTPTWIVAAVCSLIVFISLVVERLLHRLGKVPPFPSFVAFFPPSETPCIARFCGSFQVLKRKNQKPLFEALQKVKEGALRPYSLLVSLDLFGSSYSIIK